jgi:hypothetical protein
MIYCLEARKSFLEWHDKETTAGYVFNLQKDLIDYCKSDVDILLKCCMKFRDIFIAETSIDPLLYSLTIASACNLVFRRKFLQPEQIGVVPVGGYRRAENQSVAALKWIMWTSEQRHIRIQHKLNGGEYKIHPYSVDGYNAETNTVYEFHGCW